ncbi:uncharacterized protein LOC117067984 [Trachypithecus francoisi]|uniref:uncharacterized protein LOC117067984 n=1 Tax=Trachypithecus francoisi TaxID=54180 RepID=UPI00141AA981|nr:uncharacterized protein LOC117067984 [Trachypithecus francoisi]
MAGSRWAAAGAGGGRRRVRRSFSPDTEPYDNLSLASDAHGFFQSLGLGFLLYLFCLFVHLMVSLGAPLDLLLSCLLYSLSLSLSLSPLPALLSLSALSGHLGAAPPRLWPSRGAPGPSPHQQLWDPTAPRVGAGETAEPRPGGGRKRSRQYPSRTLFSPATHWRQGDAGARAPSRPQRRRRRCPRHRHCLERPHRAGGGQRAATWSRLIPRLGRRHSPQKPWAPAVYQHARRMAWFRERAPKATCRRPAPGRAPSACGNRPLHPARDAELRENLVQRGLNARAPPRGRFLSRPHPPGDHRAASPAARRQK